MDHESDQPDFRNDSEEKGLEGSTFNASVTITGVDEATHADDAGEQDGEDRVFEGSLLRPVQFWDESSPSAGETEVLQPGIELQESAAQDESDNDEDDVPLMLISQTNRLMMKEKPKVQVVTLLLYRL
jgi:hypothetical protein